MVCINVYSAFWVIPTLAYYSYYYFNIVNIQNTLNNLLGPNKYMGEKKWK